MTSSQEDLILAFAKEGWTLHNQSTSDVVPCNKEEADTGVFLHARDKASDSGFPHVLIKTVNTDVLINALIISQSGTRGTVDRIW